MIEILILLILLILILSNGEDEESVCALCSNATDHIYCKFPSPYPILNNVCKDVDTTLTNDKFRKKILNWHNNYRSKFAEGTFPGQERLGFPQAANMRLMRYDYQLERLALRNVQNCYFEHEPCRIVQRFGYGQNLAHIAWTGDILPPMTNGSWEAWVEEMKDYDVADVSATNSSTHRGVVDHFIQVTWAKARLIGCAQVYSCKEGSHRFDLACNYGNSNISGEPMYEIGPPCSKCPNGTHCGVNIDYPNLCGLISNIEEEDNPYLSPNFD